MIVFQFQYCILLAFEKKIITSEEESVNLLRFECDVYGIAMQDF